jgi:hypothetical protein
MYKKLQVGCCWRELAGMKLSLEKHGDANRRKGGEGNWYQDFCTVTRREDHEAHAPQHVKSIAQSFASGVMAVKD